jgi:hypothetical protein
LRSADHLTGTGKGTQGDIDLEQELMAIAHRAHLRAQRQSRGDGIEHLQVLQPWDRNVFSPQRVF